jgi:UDP-3-O-[3-hydroxymyristoyl] glucosamine N-acyltransferase
MENASEGTAAAILKRPMTAQEIAERIGARLAGDCSVTVKWARSVQSADEQSLVFVEDPKRLPEALRCRAQVIVTGEFAELTSTSKTLLIVAQPKLGFAKASKLLHPEEVLSAGVHSTAVVDPSANLAANVAIGPHAVIEAQVRIGSRTSIGANSVIGTGVSLGEDCVIKGNVTIYPGTEVGDRVIVHSGAVLGSDGFGYVLDRDTGRYEKFPQRGSLRIGDDVEIGANSTVDRGALDETTISDGVKIDNLVHVGHNVHIGRNVVIAAQTGISGSVVIEDNVIIAGQVGIADHVRIEEGAILGAQCGIPSNKVIRGKGILFWGTPARPIREYLKELAVLSRMTKK